MSDEGQQGESWKIEPARKRAVAERFADHLVLTRLLVQVGMSADAAGPMALALLTDKVLRRQEAYRKGRKKGQ